MPSVLDKLTFRCLRQKAKQSLIHTAPSAHIILDPYTGELRIEDRACMPEIGMFSVLSLDGVKILVQYIRELPFRAPQADQGITSYFYVRPALEIFDIREGTNFTLLVGDRHFLVEIDTVLSSPLLKKPEPARRPVFSEEDFRSTQHEGSSDDQSPELSEVGRHVYHPRCQSQIVSTPKQSPNTKETKERGKPLPPTPETLAVQLTAPNTPRNGRQSTATRKIPSLHSSSPIPEPVIPNRPDESSMPASRSPRNTSIVLDRGAEGESPKRKCQDLQTPQAKQTVAHDDCSPLKQSTITVPSTRTRIADYSPSPRTKRTSLQPENKEGMKSTSSPRSRVVLNVDEHGRPLAYPTPATTPATVQVYIESTPVSSGTARTLDLKEPGLDRSLDNARRARQPSESRSNSKALQEESAAERHLRSTPKRTESALGLSLGPPLESMQISTNSPYGASPKLYTHRRTVSEQHHHEPTTSPHLHEKQKTLPKQSQRHCANESQRDDGDRYLPSPQREAVRRMHPSASPPSRQRDEIYERQINGRRPVDPDLRSDASNCGSDYSPTTNETLVPAVCCKECGTHLEVPPSPLGPPLATLFGEVVGPGPELSGVAKVGYVAKDVTHFVWRFSLAEGVPVPESVAVDRHRQYY